MLQNVRIKCIFASNAFDAKMHFCNAPTKCTHCLCFLLCKKHSSIKYIFASNTFVTFCFAEHFPKENVQHQQNVMQKYIFAKHQIHFCIKCICNILLCWTFYFVKCSAPTKCTHCLCFLLCKKHSSTFVFCKAKNTAFFRFRGALTFCWCWTFSKRKCSAPAKC